MAKNSEHTVTGSDAVQKRAPSIPCSRSLLVVGRCRCNYTHTALGNPAKLVVPLFDCSTRCLGLSAFGWPWSRSRIVNKPTSARRTRGESMGRCGTERCGTTTCLGRWGCGYRSGSRCCCQDADVVDEKLVFFLFLPVCESTVVSVTGSRALSTVFKLWVFGAVWSSDSSNSILLES
ncbi:hypothetical protein P280DRAFT_303066 [Massarina eburnea CBS 473.64]|uniref:Uncharacterized protein n=1 Tax=Massarina eburnea CBS 473.64 TaxID=1395130 RepID=A0A6A6S211_9PLEO|nr:hypothetical protein P280DRAFT_303066 [Massarina eburnea CBS 473.64]